MSSARVLALITAGLFLGAPAALAGDPPAYTFVDLGTLGGPASGAMGLNDQRQVVGWSTTNATCVINDHLCRTAFLWEDGVMTDLGFLPGDEESVARAINNDGLIVGTSEFDILFGSGTFHGVTWTGGAIAPLADFGAGSFPSDVNASGRIAGWAMNPGVSADRAVTWFGGVLTNEGSGEEHSYNRAQGISDDGRLAGFAWNLFSPNDAIAQNGGVWKTVGGIDGPFQNAEARDVNNAGVVVGLQAFPSGNWHPATWTIGTLGAVDVGLLPGFDLGELDDVNEAGLAVGRCYTDSAPSISHAILWDGDTRHDLNDLLPDGVDAVLYDAQEINEQGDIVGTALVGGEFHAYLLVAASAPSPWVDLRQGLAGTLGVPVFAGEGTLAAGAPITLQLDNALPGAAAHLVFGFSALQVPFKGGTMVPDVDVLFGPFAVGGTGQLVLATPFPSGAPSGFTFFVQWWIADAGGPVGLAASNGLSATTP
jgi:probable HAF family extracellular repeat protein